MTKIGVIGAGAFTDYCLDAYRQHLPTVEIAAITDINQKAAKQLAVKYTIPTVATSIDQILADDSIRILVILTPPNTHFLLAKAALVANRHVLVEKPIAFTTADAKTLICLAQEKKLEVAANLVLRFHPFHQELAKIVRANQYGSLHSISSDAFLAEYPSDHWYWKPEISGGFFLNTFCHFLDLFSFVAGHNPDSLSSLGNEKDGFQIGASFPNGLTATLKANLHATNDQERIETIYTFDQAIIRTYGWMPEKMEITKADGQVETSLSPDKPALYQKILAQILNELIERASNPNKVGIITNETLYQTVVQPLTASQNRPL